MRGNPKGLNPEYLHKIDRIMQMIEVANTAEELNFPGAYFHALKGKMQNRYSLRISRNYRLTFAWDGDAAIDIDLEDYH